MFRVAQSEHDSAELTAHAACTSLHACAVSLMGKCSLMPRFINTIPAGRLFPRQRLFSLTSIDILDNCSKVGGCGSNGALLLALRAYCRKNTDGRCSFFPSRYCSRSLKYASALPIVSPFKACYCITFFLIAGAPNRARQWAHAEKYFSLHTSQHKREAVKTASLLCCL